MDHDRNTAEHYVGTEETRMRRWRTVVAVILYCGLIVMLWFLPAMVRDSRCPIRRYGRAWLGPAKKITTKVVRAVGMPNATASPLVRAGGAICIMGILGFPFLGAILSKSHLTARIMLLAAGIVMLAAYIGLAVLCFRLRRYGYGLD